MEIKKGGELGLSVSGLICINPGYGWISVNNEDLVGALSKALGLEQDDYTGLRITGRLSLAIEQMELLEVENGLTEGTNHETV